MHAPAPAAPWLTRANGSGGGTGGHADGSDTFDSTSMRAALQIEVVYYQQHALAASSWAATNTAMRHMAMYCRLTGEYPHPTTGWTDAQVAAYIAYLARSVRHGTIENYVSLGPRRLHEELGLPWKPISARPAAKAALRGVARVYGTGPTRRKLPITREILQGIHSRINTHHINDVSVHTCMLVMFYGFLRKGNATWNKPASARGFGALQPPDTLFTRIPTPSSAPQLGYGNTAAIAERNKYVIRRGDVRRQTDGRYHLTVRGTKTIQFGQRQLELVLPHTPMHPQTCPTTWLAHYLAHTSARPDTDPLFGVIGDNGAWEPLSYTRLMRVLKTALRELNLDASQYAGHSFRRGGATYAFLAGLPEHSIRQLGDWKSDVWREYAEVQLELRKRAADMLEDAANLPSRLPPALRLRDANDDERDAPSGVPDSEQQNQ